MRGKVVLLPFPFDDLSSTKVRPAICLTDEVGPHRHVIVAFVSSQASASIEPTDLLLEPTQPDFPRPGLRATSIIRLHRLLTVGKGYILRELGSLSPMLQAEVAARLKVLFRL